MQPKDFDKKRFKMVPGADYQNGPITKYGTFVNMVRTKLNERNQQMADSLPGIEGKVNDEFIEGITDTVNPVGAIGSIVRKYSVEEVLKTLGDQKMTKDQITGFLKKKIPPKQLEMLSLDRVEKRLKTEHASDWLRQITRDKNHRLDYGDVEDDFESITLPGSNSSSYNTSLLKFSDRKHIPGSKQATTPGSHFEEPNYAGHTRATDEVLDGSPIRLVQEAQNDYAQAERQGKGMFESTLKKDLEKPIMAAAKKYLDFSAEMKKKHPTDGMSSQYRLRGEGKMSSRDRKKLKRLKENLDKTIDFKGLQTKILDSQKRKKQLLDRYEDLNDRANAFYQNNNNGDNLSPELMQQELDLGNEMQDIQGQLYAIDNNGVMDKLFKDFPIKPEAVRRDTIMNEMNNAMEQGHARIGIPIQRHGNKEINPLEGSPEVTQSYLQNVPQDFRAIKNHMAKQGIGVKLGVPKADGGDVMPSRWSSDLDEDKLFTSMGDNLSEVENLQQFYRDQYQESMADSFEELRYIMDEGFYDDDPVKQYKLFKSRIEGSMSKGEAFQELFESIDRGAGGTGPANAVYTMEFAKPAGREADAWKDIDVDWKVW